MPPYQLGTRGAEVIAQMGSLRVVQTLTAGVDAVRAAVPDGVTLCNGRGIHDSSTAELALTLTLASLRGVPGFVRAQDRREYRPAWRPALADRTVVVVGTGSIGAAIEARLAPFETTVVRVARTARDGVHAVDELPDLLPDADVVILVVPLTDETRGLVDADFLARMKPGALLVNVARGAVVVTDDLVAALQRAARHRRARRLRPRAAAADSPRCGTPGPAGHPARRRGEQRDVAARPPPGARAAAPLRGGRAAGQRRLGRLLAGAGRPPRLADVAGRIREQSIAEVREKARIDDVVSSYVTLRNAGGGSMKGLCPFHDEKSPSFHVTPSPRLLLLLRLPGRRRRHQLPHADRRAELRRGRRAPRRQVRRAAAARGRRRPRGAPSGAAARQAARGPQGRPGVLRRAAADPRGRRSRGSSSPTAASTSPRPRPSASGFAPRDGEALFRHLRARGFSQEEVVAGGLVAVGRSAYDRFRGRLMWPIREANGDTIGFGARRIFDDDRIDAKYLNTSETPIYKKSQVLYGIDLARREIGRTSQAVVVEGYTDVMACHLAGVGTAVASCGTAFGDDHGRVLRRFMADHEQFRGEVIFTFDGDAAGQRAALKTFSGDANFVSQTYVAVEPNGLDPCDLRIKEGDAAVRELVARREPLYRFVLRNIVSTYDLDRADGRVAARARPRGWSPASATQSKSTPYAREIAALIGVDLDSRPAARSPRRAAGAGAAQGGPPGRRSPSGPASRTARASCPTCATPGSPSSARRSSWCCSTRWSSVAPPPRSAPTTSPTPRSARVWELVAAAGGPLAGARRPGLGGPRARRRRRGPARCPRRSRRSPSTRCSPPRRPTPTTSPCTSSACWSSPRCGASRRSSRACSAPTRVEDPDAYNRMFGELAALEQHRRALRDRIVGEQ